MPRSTLPLFNEVDVSIDSNGQLQILDRSGQPLEARILRRFKQEYKHHIDNLYRAFERDTNAETDLIFDLQRRLKDIPDQEDWIDRRQRREFMSSDFILPKPTNQEIEQSALEKAKTELKNMEGQGCMAGCSLTAIPFLLMMTGSRSLSEFGSISLFFVPVLAPLFYYFFHSRYQESLKKLRFQYAQDFLKAATSKWEREKSTHKAEQERLKASFELEESERLEVLEKLLSGDIDELQKELERMFSCLDFHFEFFVSFEIVDPTTVFLDIDLPEIEDVPTQKANLRKDGKVSVKDKSAKEVSEHYARLCHSLLFWLTTEVFDTMPTVEQVFSSGYTQRLDPKTGSIDNVYVLAVRFDKPKLEELFLTRIDPIDAIENFEHRRKMTKTYKLSAIKPFETPPTGDA